MKVTTEREDSILNAVVEGRIDSATVSEFQHTVESAIADDDKAVLIGLQDLAYINSSGLRAILLIAKKLWKRDAKFVLYAPGSVVEEGFSRSPDSTRSSRSALPRTTPWRPRGTDSRQHRVFREALPVPGE